MNVDGVSKFNTDRAVVGCFFRNNSGQWLPGEARNLGKCSLTLAEFWAAFMGLYPAWACGYTNIILAIASTTVFDLLSDPGETGKPRPPPEVHGFNITSMNVKLSHVLREANNVADEIANWALTQPLC